ncbi:hypothetical protein HU727_008305 [Pseudomonas sp. SWRI153]|uniref:Uncharacterized protein n=1 Tax=Pseudomonas khorasanensis TaxID=2745508 RepID=A0A923F2C8_9PSED|nr:hypothetical protein [Pseudomonas khorasanensis]MBV4485585.1 hypothetical protein [Pseudomonas khorasanensis]
MGVAVITVTCKGIRLRALARNQNFGKDAALQPFSYCSEVVKPTLVGRSASVQNGEHHDGAKQT